REWGSDRSGGGPSADLRLEHLEHGGPIAVELLQSHPADLAETIDRTRFGLDDAVQRGIGEDDIGGHTLLLGLLGPPGAQGLEQGGVGGVEFCLGPASAAGSCLLARSEEHTSELQSRFG